VATPDITIYTSPTNPDGDNNWFITGPEIELYPDYTSDVYWQWNSSSGSWNVCSGANPTSGASFYAPSGNNLLYYFGSGAVSGSGPVDTYTFGWDDVAPSGAIVAPSGTEYISGDYLLQASGEDDVSGLWKYVWRVNGKLISEVKAPIDAVYWDTREEEDGIKILYMELIDYAGNSTGDSVYIYTDNNPPYITNEEIPTPVTSGSVAIYGDAVDAACPIDFIEYRLLKTDADRLVEVWEEATITSGSGTPEVAYMIPLSGLSDGDLCTLWIRGADLAGNITSQANYLTITFPVSIL